VKRHPTIRNNVVIGAGAKVIGAIEIGENSRVGAGSVVVTNVPPNATIVGVPGHIVAFRDESNGAIQRLPDPEWERLNELERRIEELHELVHHLETHTNGAHAEGHGAGQEPSASVPRG
jgi:serine O-acetyltransferase